ncbi:MAG: polyphosphate kinase 1, partial [Pseudomonadota bacterium]
MESASAAFGNEGKIDSVSPRRFINRELSWLAFNQRVLEESQNKNHPLLERLRFLSISAKNLDEFYMVRVAGLRAQVAVGVTTPSADGLTPSEQLSAINGEATRLVADQQECWQSLQRELRNQGIWVASTRGLTKADKTWLDDHFMDVIFPVLTPLAIDPVHPFPFIPNLGLTLALLLENRSEGITRNAIVPLPAQLDRFIRLPGKKARYLLLEDLVLFCLERLFPGHTALDHGVFRVIRDSEMEIDDEAQDLVKTFETALKRRRRGSVVQLTLNSSMPEALSAVVREELKVHQDQVMVVDGLVGLADTGRLISNDRSDLVFPSYNARFPGRVVDFDGNCFAAIRNKDFVVHHPYESFDVVVDFLRQAARDPDVVAIKQTLYRTSKDSAIVHALIEAAEAGKSVTAMVELKARFDEEANLR